MARYFLAGAATVDMLVGDQIVATANTLLDSSITIGSTQKMFVVAPVLSC